MNKRNEKLSAYLDGEIHQDELMSFSLSGEADDAKTAMRYQLMGDALRGDTSELSTFDISAAVREALADENIVDQMQEKASSHSATQQTPEKTSETGAGILSWLSLRPLGGMAIAATVAAVMVLSVTQQDPQQAGPLAQIKPVNSATPVTLANKTVAPVQQIIPAQFAVNQTAPAQSVPVSNNAELSPYLNQHFATQGTLQSRMSYVRTVSFEPAQ